MFPGSAFGVDVTVAQLCPVVPGPPPAAGERPMRLDEMLPAESMTDAELAREIQRATQAEAVIAAYKAERVLQLAARRPSSLDRRRGNQAPQPSRTPSSRPASPSSSPTSWPRS